MINMYIYTFEWTTWERYNLGARPGGTCNKEIKSKHNVEIFENIV